MRFSLFLALLVATFVACTTVANAENVVLQTNNEVRRLRSEAGVNQENVAKIAGGFISKIKESATLTKALNMAKAANGDEAAAKRVIMLAAGVKEGAKLSDETMVKLSAMIAESAKKNPKSWPRLKKFAKVALGVQVGALAIYGAYKLFFDKSSSTAAAMTTTTTSSGAA
ncbi:hypothetical protein V7S43_008670 [Phytophthora oleae]|uniref:RxLR effector protein n=1 Tax=Phytophthora oleae TaxID=2107226 RepID=A0ABD3FJC8_9STRA